MNGNTLLDKSQIRACGRPTKALILEPRTPASNVSNIFGLYELMIDNISTVTELQLLYGNTWARKSDDRQAIYDTARLLLYESDIEPPWYFFTICKESFSLWLQKLYSHYYDLPLRERVGIAFQVYSFPT